jgi:hypothetical protein
LDPVIRQPHNCPYRIPTCTGCGPGYNALSISSRASSRAYLGFAEDMADDNSSEHESNTSSFTTLCRSLSPLTLQSAQGNRDQLLQQFIYMFFPVADHDTDFMYSKFGGRELLRASSAVPSTRAALDALCLLQIGTYHKNKALLHEGVSRYDTAVATLRYDLERKQAVYEDGVLGAAWLLTVCEIFDAVSVDGYMQRTHHKGMVHIILERGPNARYSSFCQLLLYNIRHVRLLSDLLDRKACSLRGPAWKRCAALTTGLISDFTELALHVPGLLEQCDKLLADPRNHAHRTLDYLNALTRVERDLKTWELKWLGSITGLPYWTVKSSRFNQFTLHTANAPDVFPKAYEFPSFAVASVLTQYWTVLLQVKETMLDATRASYGNPLKKGEDSMTLEANECADNLCQSAAWLSLPKHGSCGVMRPAAPLHYAAQWYKKQGNEQKHRWCCLVKRALEATGIVTPYREEFEFENASELRERVVEEGLSPKSSVS